MVMNNLRSAVPYMVALLATLGAALAVSPASAQATQSVPQTEPVGRPLTLGSLQVYPSISAARHRRGLQHLQRKRGDP